MKAILEIEMPEACMECPLCICVGTFYPEDLGPPDIMIWQCGYLKRRVVRDGRREDCPLKLEGET